MRTIIATLSLLALISVGLGMIPSQIRAASIADSAAIASTTSTSNDNNSNSSSSDNKSNPVLAAASAGPINLNERLSTTGSTDQPEKPSGPENIILQIVPKKSMGVIGRSLDIAIAAKHENGTGIPGVKIVAQIGDNGKESVKLGGTTDDKGVLIVTPIIGEHAQPGQFSITATAIKNGFTTAQVSSGFAVDEPSGGSTSSSSSSSSGGGSSSKCSGSSCR